MKPSVNSVKKENTSWIKRIGVVGFAFFLIKGIFWMVAIWAGYSFF